MTKPVVAPDEKQLLDLCTESVAALERALQLKPEDLTRQVQVAERAVVRLRDTLIGRMRDGPASDRTRWRAELDRVNAALSVIVGVEYPVAGIQKSLLEQARNTLKTLLADA